MADAAARREARRKRILENSHNRLQLISGKNNDDSFKESPRKSPIPPQVYETTIETDNSVASSYSLLNGVLGTELELPQTLPSKHDVASGDTEHLNEFAAFRPPQAPEPTQSPLWKSVITYKYDIVLLSLLLQIVYEIASVSFENTYFFLPLIIYTVTKLFWFPSQSNSSIANVLLLLNGMSPQRIHKILKIVHAAGCISQDLSIYLFTTICIHIIFMTLKDSFVT